MPVHDRHQVQKAPCHRDVADIDAPRLIGLCDSDAAQRALYQGPVILSNTWLVFSLATVHSKAVSLFRTIPAKAFVPPEFAADGGFMDAHNQSNFALIKSGFHQRMDQVSLFVGPHLCSSYSPVEEATMLPQLALLPSQRVALTS